MLANILGIPGGFGVELPLQHREDTQHVTILEHFL